MNKTQSIIVAGLALGFSLAACNSGDMRRNPGKIYAPDMTYSRAYDAYTHNPVFEDSMSSRKPVEGTIAIGHELPDHLVEGDTNAYKRFTTSMRFNEADLDEGRRLYNIYCGVCHGAELNGEGPLYTSGKFAAMPTNLVNAEHLSMPEGEIYATIKFGKNMMGSYASQLDVKQRWQIVAYIKKVQSDKGGGPFTLGTPAAVAAATPEADAGAETDAVNGNGH